MEVWLIDVPILFICVNWIELWILILNIYTFYTFQWRKAAPGLKTLYSGLVHSQLGLHLQSHHCRCSPFLMLDRHTTFPITIFNSKLQYEKIYQLQTFHTKIMENFNIHWIILKIIHLFLLHLNLLSKILRTHKTIQKTIFPH